MPRIGTGYNILLTQQQMAKNRYAHSRALEPLSTGRAINRPSDEPTRIAEYFRNTADTRRIEQYSQNVASARTRVNITDSTLASVGDLLNEAYTLALQGNDQTLSPNEMSYITTRLTDIKSDVVNLANTKLGDSYIFAGFKTTTEPFSGTPTVFNGDSNSVMIKVTGTKQVQVSVDADELFMGGGTGVDIFDTIDDLVTTIQAGDEVAMESLITDIQTALDQVNTGRANIANASKALETADSTLEDLNTQLAERMASLADIDIASATTELSFREFTLQASLAVSRRVMEIQLQSFFE